MKKSVQFWILAAMLVLAQAAVVQRQPRQDEGGDSAGGGDGGDDGDAAEGTGANVGANLVNRVSGIIGSALTGNIGNILGTSAGFIPQHSDSRNFLNTIGGSLNKIIGSGLQAGQKVLVSTSTVRGVPAAAATVEITTQAATTVAAEEEDEEGDETEEEAASISVGAPGEPSARA